MMRTTFLLILGLTLFACKSDQVPEETTVVEEEEPVRQVEEKPTLKQAVTNRDSTVLATAKKAREPQKLKRAVSKDAPVTSPPENSGTLTEIEFEERTLDFGEITEGTVVDLEVKFKNTGKNPLSIVGAEVTCGCTTPSIPFLDIAPGESGVIGVQYNSVGKSGKQNPQLTIKANTHPASHIINLHGTVLPRDTE